MKFHVLSFVENSMGNMILKTQFGHGISTINYQMKNKNNYGI